MIVKRDFEIWKCYIKISLKLFEGKLISFFKPLIIVGILLVAIVCEMHKLILVIQWIFIRASPHISYLVEEQFHLICCQSQHSNIKFPLVVEQWLFNVLLYNPLQIWRLALQILSHLFETIEYLNTFPLIQVRRF